MKKTLSLALVFMFVAQFVTLPVQALEIVINNNGSTYFYEDQVLGKDSEENEDENEEEKEVEKEEKRQEKEEKKEDHQELKIERREIKIEKKEEKRTDAPTKVLPSSTKNQIRLKQENAKTEVKIENKQLLKKGIESQESTENERVEIKMPAQLKATPHPEATPHPDATPQPLEKVLEERRERKDETVKIQSKTNDDGTREFEFESRLIKAKAQGAEFVVDPTTNNVTVITPSGQEHVLTHLPDQAVARLHNSGVINTDAITNGAQELSIETKEDGSVVYKTKAEKVKKILGFINRTVETEVELDDQTGEITEKEVRASNWFSRFLNSMAN